MDRLLSSLSSGRERLDRQQAELDRLALRLCNAGDARLLRARRDADRASALLPGLGRMLGMAQEHQLSRLEVQLKALDPYEPLKRGYAMALAEDGTFLRSVEQTAPGRNVIVELSDGRLVTVVSGVERKGADA